MESLIIRLIEEGYLKTPSIIEAFRVIHRQDFVRPDDLASAGENAPQAIGYGQTISQPLTVAFMLELVNPVPGEHVLDVGAGSGWTSALFAHLVGPTGLVVGIERIPQLKHFAQENLKKYAFPQLELRQGDGSLGAADRAPFDIIHAAAAAGEEIPKELKRQLKIGGRFVIPLGSGALQTIILLRKTDKNTYLEERFPGFTFVPLIEGPS